MGYGDFKLLAALGAWLGAPFLLAIILMSSMVGAVIGVLLIVRRQAGQQGHSHALRALPGRRRAAGPWR
jgi:leader peptidase (prepilin peptidase)/N-methyltransferase